MTSPPASVHDALIVVDVQRDFLPGGALGVAAGESVIAPLNACSEALARAGARIYATRDWHPPDHCSFQAQGGPWPTHCVAGTAGAEFPATLRLPRGAVVVSKAERRDRDAYSGFDGTDLASQLRAADVTRLWIGGLATDYCVRATVLDARRLGFEVLVLTDAVRAVELNAGDGARALADMQAAGARLQPGGPTGPGP
ncbi:MAG TPA: isochorismatase family protein [Steroidobacteraceae bacterium]|nr:isochorismatase family protein [Steroidobacteraceae bacterium]